MSGNMVIKGSEKSGFCDDLVSSGRHGLQNVNDASLAPHQIERYETYTVMYRPFGPKELLALAETNFSAWPPRLPEQPIFYPVTNRDYANQITAQWNVPEGAAGFVAKFRVSNEFADRYPVQQVGGREHTEWWIPAGELDEMNRNLIGSIEITDAHGAFSEYSDLIALARSNKQAFAEEQTGRFSRIKSYSCKVTWVSTDTAAKHANLSHLECQLNIPVTDGDSISYLVGLTSPASSHGLGSDGELIQLVAFHPIPAELTQPGKSLRFFYGKDELLGEITFTASV